MNKSNSMFNAMTAVLVLALWAAAAPAAEKTSRNMTLADCVGEIDAIAEAAMAVRKDVIILCHGGPIAQPEDAGWILQRTANCHGFYGASSMERLPAEIAIRDQTASFKGLSLRK